MHQALGREDERVAQLEADASGDLRPVPRAAHLGLEVAAHVLLAPGEHEHHGDLPGVLRKPAERRPKAAEGPFKTLAKHLKSRKIHEKPCNIHVILRYFQVN